MAHVFTTGQVGGVEIVASLAKAEPTVAFELVDEIMRPQEKSTILDDDRESQ